MSAVVGRSGVHLDRELNAWAERELIGVNPQSEPARSPSLQDLPGGVELEDARFAEDVAPLGLVHTGLEHRPGDEIDVLALAPAVLRGYDVGSEVGDLFRDRLGDLEAP